MLCFEDIRISIKSQGFEIKEFGFSPHEDQTERYTVDIVLSRSQIQMHKMQRNFY